MEEQKIIVDNKSLIIKIFRKENELIITATNNNTYVCNLNKESLDKITSESNLVCDLDQFEKFLNGAINNEKNLFLSNEIKENMLILTLTIKIEMFKNSFIYIIELKKEEKKINEEILTNNVPSEKINLEDEINILKKKFIDIERKISLIEEKHRQEIYEYEKNNTALINLLYVHYSKVKKYNNLKRLLGFNLLYGYN